MLDYKINNIFNNKKEKLIFSKSQNYFRYKMKVDQMKLAWILVVTLFYYSISEEMTILEFKKTSHSGANPYAELMFENTTVSTLKFCIKIRLYFKYHKES